jgi:malate dehydrogenase (oxaloacetate-decarboxylating)
VEKADYQRPSAGFSVTIEVKIQNLPGRFSEIVSYIAKQKGSLSDVTLLASDVHHTYREITINCKSQEHSEQLLSSLRQLESLSILKVRDDTFAVHQDGKLEVTSKLKVETTDQLARVYTPGVARVCMAIHKDPELSYKYTVKGNTIAVVSDGSAVLGLGDIGPLAALPVMEGKAMLFKRFAGLNAFPVCLDTTDTEELIKIIKSLSVNFGGINLEDISAPRCFEIEKRLREELDIPVFHDDQHGTAVVVLAGLINALKIVGKKLGDLKVAVSGFGAGGVACARMLLSAGVKNIVACDRAGIVYRGRKERMNEVKEELALITNPDNAKGGLKEALQGADVFIGVSEPGLVNRSMIKSMADNPIVFALANPTPEILPAEIEGIARIIATGRSDYANQVNNVLCFPGIFRGALNCRARDINDKMKIAAAYAIAQCVKDSELCEDYIIPGIFRPDVPERVALEVEKAAIATGAGSYRN